MNNYTLTPEEFEIIDNMILYYDVHGVEKIQQQHPEWIVDDFKKLLTTLNTIINR